MHSQLTDELTNALKAVVADAKQRLAGQTIYSIAIYTSGEYSYVIDSVMTLEGLSDVAKDYLKDDRYKQEWGTLDTACAALKWSAPDSPYHEAFAKHFDAAQQTLDAIWQQKGESNDPYAIAHLYHIHEAIAAALRRLAASNSASNDNVTYNILMGDQSDEERLLNAENLNPEPIANALRRELDIDSDSLAELRRSRWKAD